MSTAHFMPRRQGKDMFASRRLRQRPVAAHAEIGLREVPSGRSWFYSIRVGDSCTLVEHRIPAGTIGANADPARQDYTKHHLGLTHAEATRMKRALCGQGLFYAGGPL